MALSLAQFATSITYNTGGNIAVNFTGLSPGDQLIVVGIVQHGGTTGPVVTSVGDTGVFQKINGATTPETDTGNVNNLGLDYFCVLFTNPTPGCTGVIANMSGNPQFNNLGVWVVRGAVGPLVQDIGIFNNQGPAVTICESGLSGTLARAVEFAVSMGISGNYVSGVNTAQTGSAGFVSDGGDPNGNWYSHQITSATTPIQAAFNDASSTCDTFLCTFYDSGAGGGSTAALLGNTRLALSARAVPSGKVHITGASRVAVTAKPAQTATAKLTGTIKTQVSGRSKPTFPARLAGNTLAAVRAVSKAAGKVKISGASKIAIMGRLAKPGAIALLGRAFVSVMGRAAPRGVIPLRGAMTLTVQAKAQPTFGQKLAGAMKIVVGSQSSLLGRAGLSGMTMVKASGVASVSRIAALAATTKIGLHAAASMSGRVALSGATKITSSARSTLSHLGQIVQLSGSTAFRLAARALLFIFEPSSRFAIVPVEDRTATAPTEIRSVSVPVEVRTATVPTEIRSASVLVENRSAIVPPNT